MIEFDQDHGAVDAVVVDARRIRAADPGEPGAVDLPLNLVHLHAGVAVIHVANVEVHEIQKLLALLRRKVRGARARVIDHDIVLEGFG